MVPSITDYLNGLLTGGITRVLCAISRDEQTALLHMAVSAVGAQDPEAPPRVFAAYGDLLLPLDGVQTFSEAVMRSGMTDAQKVEWLLMTCQEYEQEYARTVAKAQREEGA